MRRVVQEYRAQVHRSSGPPRRAISMLCLLVLLCLVVSRVANPSMWHWLASSEDEPRQTVAQAEAQGKPADGKPAAEESSDKPAEAKADQLAPTGPTDEDFEEIEAMREARQVIYDGGQHTTREEMVAYNRVLNWVYNQPLELLRKRARKDAIFDQFISTPDEMRFKLFELKLDVRQIIKCDVKGPHDADLYEVRGFTAEGGPMVHFGVVMDLPKGMPVGDQVRVQGRLVGYFFKLQGYIPQLAKPNSRPLKAPMFIGRLAWQGAPPAQAEPTPVWVWSLLAAIITVVTLGGVVIAARLGRGFRAPAPLVTRLGGGDVPVFDEWLDQAQAGELGVRNSFSDPDESTVGPGRPG